MRPGLAARTSSAAERGAGETLEQAMLGWQVATALERLTPEHRQMIRLAHLQGMTMREIAEQTRLPVGTVKSRTWYALRALRLVLEEMGVADELRCEELRTLLGGYVLEALEPEEAAEVRAHLRGCPACAAEHASLAGLPALLELARGIDQPIEPLPEGFEEELLDRFTRERGEPPPRRRRRLPG